MLTESLLATLAYVAPETYFTERDICNYYLYLLGNMPVYIPTNLSVEMIEYTVEEYPDVFKIKHEGDSIAISGDTTDCLNYFLRCSNEMQQLILRLTERWIKENKR